MSLYRARAVRSCSWVGWATGGAAPYRLRVSRVRAMTSGSVETSPGGQTMPLIFQNARKAAGSKDAAARSWE